MSDPDPATGTASPATGRRPAPARRGWRWVPVLFAALVEALAIAPVGALPFYLSPLVLGLTYLAAAVVGGRHATLWAPGLVISAWGVAVVLVFGQTVHTDFASVAARASGPLVEVLPAGEYYEMHLPKPTARPRARPPEPRRAPVAPRHRGQVARHTRGNAGRLPGRGKGNAGRGPMGLWRPVTIQRRRYQAQDRLPSRGDAA